MKRSFQVEELEELEQENSLQNQTCAEPILFYDRFDKAWRFFVDHVVCGSDPVTGRNKFIPFLVKNCTKPDVQPFLEQVMTELCHPTTNDMWMNQFVPSNLDNSDSFVSLMESMQLESMQPLEPSSSTCLPENGNEIGFTARQCSYIV